MLLILFCHSRFMHEFSTINCIIVIEFHTFVIICFILSTKGKINERKNRMFCFYLKELYSQTWVQRPSRILKIEAIVYVDVAFLYKEIWKTGPHNNGRSSQVVAIRAQVWLYSKVVYKWLTCFWSSDGLNEDHQKRHCDQKRWRCHEIFSSSDKHGFNRF